MSDREIILEHNSTFVKWFENRLRNVDVDPRLKSLSMGPYTEVFVYDGFIVNGFRFHTKRLESRKATQNSGVLVKGATYNEDEKDYYGHIEQVVKMNYFDYNSVFLFKCEWYNVDKGVRVDEYGFTQINTKSRLRSNDPFVLASQVHQVFYADSISSKTQGWSTVIKAKARNTYDIIEDDAETYQEDEAPIMSPFDAVNLRQNDVENLSVLDESQPGEEIDPIEVE